MPEIKDSFGMCDSMGLVLRGPDGQIKDERTTGKQPDLSAEEAILIASAIINKILEGKNAGN